jgi:hypothetical protein
MVRVAAADDGEQINGVDSTVRLWDIRTLRPRCVHCFGEADTPRLNRVRHEHSTTHARTHRVQRDREGAREGGREGAQDLTEIHLCHVCSGLETGHETVWVRESER